MTSFLPCYKRTAEETYLNHKIEVVFYPPDYGLQVDGAQLGSFYADTASALRIGRRHVEEIINAEQKK